MSAIRMDETNTETHNATSTRRNRSLPNDTAMGNVTTPAAHERAIRPCERQAINAPVQGSAADIIKRAMIRVPAALDNAKLDARMLLQVHDELLFEVPDDQVERTIETVAAVMEGATAPRLELNVPLVVDSGVGDNWDDAH